MGQICLGPTQRCKSKAELKMADLTQADLTQADLQGQSLGHPNRCKIAGCHHARWQSTIRNKMPDNFRSQVDSRCTAIAQPSDAACCWFGDFTKPIVGIANGYSTISLQHGAKRIGSTAEVGIRNAGAMPQMFGTITISDGISMGTEGMKYSLVSREVIADSLRQPVVGRVWMGAGDWRLRQEEYARGDGCDRMNIPSFCLRRHHQTRSSRA